MKNNNLIVFDHPVTYNKDVIFKKNVIFGKNVILDCHGNMTVHGILTAKDHKVVEIRHEEERLVYNDIIITSRWQLLKAFFTFRFKRRGDD